MDTSRTKDYLAYSPLSLVEIVFVGAGGVASLILHCIRCGIRNIKVIDYDCLEACNIPRTVFNSEDIGKFKVNALEKMARRIVADLNFQGIIADFLTIPDHEIDSLFSNASCIVMATDNHSCQAKGNIVALRLNKPCLFAGWYDDGRVGELFFQYPGLTPACYRCAVSSRYEENRDKVLPISSSELSILHGELMNSYMGFLLMAMLHRDSEKWTHYERDGNMEKVKRNSAWLDLAFFDYNFLHISTHPESNFLFDRAYGHLGKHAFNFMSHWQRINPEIPAFGYDYTCPDCQGKLYEQTLENTKTSE